MTEPLVSILVPDMPPPEAVLPYLRRIEANHRYTNFGPLSEEFEQRIAAGFIEKSGALIHATAVSSATLGIELALVAFGLSPGSRVLIPALTFAGTGTAVVRAGLEPVIADIDDASWMLTPTIAREAMERCHFDAVVAVATFGAPQDLAGWDNFRNTTGIPVLIDAASAYGNQGVQGKCPVVFSFHATKNIGVGEGGLVACSDAEFIGKVRSLSNFGFEGGSGIAAYVGGTNAKFSEYQAAVGLAALDRWESVKEGRRRILSLWLQALEPMRGTKGVSLQRGAEDCLHTIFPLRFIKLGDVQQLALRLAEGGIETRRWYYPPLPGHPVFGKYRKVSALPVTMKLSGQLLCMPFHSFLSQADIVRITDALSEALT